jgi:hypothetical protein
VLLQALQVCDPVVDLGSSQFGGDTVARAAAGRGPASMLKDRLIAAALKGAMSTDVRFAMMRQ